MKTLGIFIGGIIALFVYVALTSFIIHATVDVNFVTICWGLSNIFLAASFAIQSGTRFYKWYKSGLR